MLLEFWISFWNDSLYCPNGFLVFWPSVRCLCRSKHASVIEFTCDNYGICAICLIFVFQGLGKYKKKMKVEAVLCSRVTTPTGVDEHMHCLIRAPPCGFTDNGENIVQTWCEQDVSFWLCICVSCASDVRIQVLSTWNIECSFLFFNPGLVCNLHHEPIMNQHCMCWHLL